MKSFCSNIASSSQSECKNIWLTYLYILNPNNESISIVKAKNQTTKTMREKKNHRSSISVALEQAYTEGLGVCKISADSNFSVSIATSTEDREAAYKLAYQVYRAKGFATFNARQILTNPYDLREDTIVLVVKHFKNVIGTLTLLFDHSSDLPIATVFGEEIHHLKQRGEKVVEVSRLAFHPDYRSVKEILRLLFNYVAICIHIKQYNSLVIEVNPRHQKFYESLLNFQRIGTEKPCPHVQNAPAVLLHLSYSRYIQKRKENTAICELDAKKQERSLYSSFMNSENEAYFKKNIAKQICPITEEQIEYFELKQ